MEIDDEHVTRNCARPRVVHRHRSRGQPSRTLGARYHANHAGGPVRRPRSERWRGVPDIEGVWEEQVAQVDCADGSVLRSFRAINTFGSGGSLIAINSSPPPLAAPALGSWWRVSRHGDFGAKMKFFRYNPDGSFAGSQEVTRTMLLDMDGEALTGDITFEVFDANDQVIATGCARETGLRFR